MWGYILENVVVIIVSIIMLKLLRKELRIWYILLVVVIDIILIVSSIIIKNYKIKNNKDSVDVVSSDLIQEVNEEENNDNFDESQSEKQEIINEEIKDVTGVIYLTFDDGPSTTSTPIILDILKEKDVKATFFLLNYNEEGEELLKREIAEGHTIGIHGYSHDYKKIYQSVDTYMDNIIRLHDKIKESTGYNATITRFPGGSSNTVSRKYCKGIMTELTQIVLDSGYKYFDWNVSSEDAGSAKNSEDVYNYVINYLQPERDNVVLMHDFSNNYKTIDVLADIIDYGKENGYIFKAIDENTPMVTHHVNN